MICIKVRIGVKMEEDRSRQHCRAVHGYRRVTYRPTGSFRFRDVLQRLSIVWGLSYNIARETEMAIPEPLAARGTVVSLAFAFNC